MCRFVLVVSDFFMVGKVCILKVVCFCCDHGFVFFQLLVFIYFCLRGARSLIWEFIVLGATPKRLLL